MKRLIPIVALAALLAACGDDDGGTTTTAADGATTVAVVDDGPADIVDDDSITVLAQYDILSGDVLEGQVDPGHLAVWERFSSLFPAETRTEVIQFVAIDMAASGDTDGAMQKSSVNEADFYIALDVTGQSTELDRTMIHEFAHLLSLRTSQIDFASTDQACDTFTVDYNCPFEDAYLRAWSDEFWAGYVEADLDAELETPEDEAEARFDPAEFVTEYAATSPGEDFAEVFAEWVIRDEAPDDGTTVAAKFAFFDEWPELVDLRDRIRESL